MPDPHFDEEWIGETQLVKLAWLAAETNGLTGDAVEFGVHQGRSAIPIANAIYPGLLHAVDDWQGFSLPPEIRARDNYGIFLANLDAAAKDNVHVWKMDWRQWVLINRGVPVRFAHIDATHTAAEVSANIAAVLPAMPPGAIMAGDDFGDREVQQGVFSQLDAVRSMANMWWIKVGEPLEVPRWFDA